MFKHAYEMLGEESVTLKTPQSSLDVIEVLRSGLPATTLDSAAMLLCTSKRQLIALLGMEPGSGHWHSKLLDDRLSAKHTEHLLMMMEVLYLGGRYFGERAAALDWLNKPTPVFGGVAPMSLLDTATGISIITDELNRLAHGMTA
ncbi:antitoxin Xre/MbcA/ParS toxin-binding domain-containing protein [Shewanella atlantica]|uniref:DUF2384 domain-containing protein n=1 Tax=Shewanella atlantica TaxID=271099 RepID=A0A431VUX8_9GAMM|nr:antitoxin Xre/MbcA/ParS toxin-binding domain-containing protein [Shewanella atlantica]RTR27013.1 DUF2384 domain-containing protein [Shewanella atlantica]